MTSRTRTARRACDGKRRHRTEADARKHRAHLIERGAAADALVAYPCPAGCGGWHVGHREGRRRAR